MRDKSMKRWSTYEPFFIEFNGYKIADIVVTSHALSRWSERVNRDQGNFDYICNFMWDVLKNNRILPYYENEKEVYLIDDDLAVVSEFMIIQGQTDIIGNPLHKMIIVTFLGRLSEDIQLRDLKAYYSWLRHSRRMTLVKNGRKRK
ncbi:hypothetical protein SAMN03159341_104251 [Paenibacillus sp. 1_12]|uniref:hypothetical protein n=1 Tax=Paenibacillus sp. 1_12 TaxID=1566278 RepID=UPI0008F122AA|nr:hypothetical protein [Paenibacillus sp. 1_12]SFL25035.1 hypothetical protein SAMN03159341_104251 [Paenibacillus sp. 1_12]